MIVAQILVQSPGVKKKQMTLLSYRVWFEQNKNAGSHKEWSVRCQCQMFNYSDQRWCSCADRKAQCHEKSDLSQRPHGDRESQHGSPLLKPIFRRIPSYKKTKPLIKMLKMVWENIVMKDQARSSRTVKEKTQNQELFVDLFRLSAGERHFELQGAAWLPWRSENFLFFLLLAFFIGWNRCQRFHLWWEAEMRAEKRGAKEGRRSYPVQRSPLPINRLSWRG